VDIGVHQDGLVHISELAHRFVKDPTEVVKVQQKVMVTVMDVDINKRRIALSLKAGQAAPSKPQKRSNGPGKTRSTRPQKASGDGHGHGPLGDRLQINLG